MNLPAISGEKTSKKFRQEFCNIKRGNILGYLREQKREKRLNEFLDFMT